MCSLHDTDQTTGLGVEFYKWVLQTLSLSRERGGYRRLNAPVRKRVRLARLGKRSRSLRGLKIRRLPRICLSWFSPLTLLAKLRDTYVSLLQTASNKLAFTEGLSLFPGFPCELGPPPGFFAHGGGGKGFKAKERELDKILELYLARTLLLTNTP